VLGNVLSLQKTLVMVTNNDTDNQDQLKRIGEQLRNMRNQHYKVGYIEFATKVVHMDKKTYYNLERGERDYKIGNLLKVLTHYSNYSLEQFFHDAGL